MWLAIASLVGMTGVAAGAFGAHALRESLSEEMLGYYEIGARYHLAHAFALLAVAGVAARVRSPWSAAAGACFLLGTAIFSGSLYALAVTAVRPLGGITPIGGGLLLLGWLLLGAAGLVHRRALRFDRSHPAARTDGG